MKISVASDHAGYEFKKQVKKLLEFHGHEVLDFGTDSKDSCDYPDFGIKAAEAVASGEADRGVLVCWTGNGMGMVANKVAGVRAGIAVNPEMAYLTRSHNDANVLVMASKYIPENQIEDFLRAFLTTDFEGGRHVARVEKMMALEK